MDRVLTVRDVGFLSLRTDPDRAGDGLESGEMPHPCVVGRTAVAARVALRHNAPHRKGAGFGPRGRRAREYGAEDTAGPVMR